MVRRIVLIIGVLALLSVRVATYAQPSEDASDSPARQPGPNGTTARQAFLDRPRRIITDERNTPETRRLTAEELLESNSPGAIELAIELLSEGGSPGTASAMCEGIVSIGTRQPERLDPRFVDPLILLLGHDDVVPASRVAAALSVFRNGQVAKHLGALAANVDQPIDRRLAAIDALASNTDRRAVVAEFIKLATLSDLSSDERTVVHRIRRRALSALRRASRIDYGPDVSAWQKWWSTKRAMSEEDWLRDRLDFAAQRNGALREQLALLRRQADGRRDAFARQINELIRSVYRLTAQQTQGDELLQEWLGHELDVFRLSALTLVREQITEGHKPAPGVRQAANASFSHASRRVRKAALEIAGYLKDPQDATAVLALLETENDPSVRESILRVLGRLDNPVAIEALVGELTDPAADTGCVREAATALGTLCSRGDVPEDVLSPSIEPLRTRFAGAATDDLRLKEALLNAMANIGAAAFLPEFVTNLSSSSPELVLAAIHGISVIGDLQSLDRVRSHLTHGDPRVRQRAAEAVGSLGTSAAHLEALLNRLSPAVETNEGVRNAAWDGFRRILNLQPPSARLQGARRLEHVPDRRLALLEELIAVWSASNPSPPEVQPARRQAASLLIEQQRFASAIPYLQDLYKFERAADAPQARQTGITLLGTHLRAGRHERAPQLIVELADGAIPSEQAAIRETVLSYLESKANAGNHAAIASLIERLKVVPDEVLGPEWSIGLGQFQLGSQESASPTDPKNGEPE